MAGKDQADEALERRLYEFLKAQATAEREDVDDGAAGDDQPEEDDADLGRLLPEDATEQQIAAYLVAEGVDLDQVEAARRKRLAQLEDAIAKGIDQIEDAARPTFATSDVAEQLANPEQARAFVNEGVKSWTLGNAPEALAAFTAALSIWDSMDLKERRELDLDRAWSRMNRGNVRATLGDLAGAVADYDAALALYDAPHLRGRPEINPDRAEILGNRSVVRRQLGDVAAAAADNEAAMHSTSIWSGIVEGGIRFTGSLLGWLQRSSGAAHIRCGCSRLGPARPTACDGKIPSRYSPPPPRSQRGRA